MTPQEGEKSLGKCVFWLGGMFSPEAFIMSTKQHKAQVSGVGGEAPFCLIANHKICLHIVR